MTFGGLAVMPRARRILRQKRNARKGKICSLQSATDNLIWLRGATQWYSNVDACSNTIIDPALAYVHCSNIDATFIQLVRMVKWIQKPPMLTKDTLSFTSIFTIAFSIINFIEWKENVDFVLQTSSPPHISYVYWNSKLFVTHDESLPR